MADLSGRKRGVKEGSRTLGLSRQKYGGDHTMSWERLDTAQVWGDRGGILFWRCYVLCEL